MIKTKKMIQRIQTLFLLLAGASLSTLFSEALPFASVFGDVSKMDDTSKAVLSDGVYDISDHILLISMVCLSIILSLAAIVAFKNRPLQMKLSRTNLVVNALLLILSVFLLFQAYDGLATGTEVSIDYGYLMPFLTIAFLVLALRFISKDEKLVRSSDRLR